MDDSSLIGIDKCLDDHDENAYNLLLAQPLLDYGQQVSLVAKLTDDVHVVCCLTNIMRLYDVLVADHLECLQLVGQQGPRNVSLD